MLGKREHIEDTGSETESSSQRVHPNQRVREVCEILEWLTTAFILAFLFRSFFLEAYRIPTGSMAETLRGDHFSVRCVQCGWRYDREFAPEDYGLYKEMVPEEDVQRPITWCPICGYTHQKEQPETVSNGDRLMVFKCIYQFSEPKRWDVIVFKNPSDPEINLIKRLIGKPGEVVEIVDGDVYINGIIARKPAKVQQELWIPLYLHDLQPPSPEDHMFDGHSWEIPFVMEGTNWRIASEQFGGIVLEGDVSKPELLLYDKDSDNQYRAMCAYNGLMSWKQLPICSDFKVSYRVKGMEDGVAGVELGKYGMSYRGWVDSNAAMYISRITENREEILESKQLGASDDNARIVEFANVDHELILRVDGEELRCDLGRERNALGNPRTNRNPHIAIFASGKKLLSHVKLMRDIHYIADTKAAHGGTGNPFSLEEDEFYALGDNTANSDDSRYWRREGIGNDRTFRPGVVPREYLVGKALYVYWPNGYTIDWRELLGKRLADKLEPTTIGRTLDKLTRLKCVPNIGEMRFIGGGKKGSQEP